MLLIHLPIVECYHQFRPEWKIPMKTTLFKFRTLNVALKDWYIKKVCLCLITKTKWLPISTRWWTRSMNPHWALQINRADRIYRLSDLRVLISIMSRLAPIKHKKCSLVKILSMTLFLISQFTEMKYQRKFSIKGIRSNID